MRRERPEGCFDKIGVWENFKEKGVFQKNSAFQTEERGINESVWVCPN